MLRSFCSKSLLYGAAFYIWSSFVLIRIDGNAHGPDLSLDPGSELTVDRKFHEDDMLADNEGIDEGSLFIPLTWSRLQEGELYTASDPEWQAFVQISKDRKRLQKLRGTMVPHRILNIVNHL